MTGGHPDEVPLTREEKAAIMIIKRLVAKWPASLWLFSGAGTLCVMRKDRNGRMAFTDAGNVDAQYNVYSTRAIPNDGGDW